ncbi:hypothetical protein B0H12DRAFT_1239406 [Mycena haematopus]|nr:hypothetical protein B0H12DRAFT_1239406 [Mycena haematopus]
MTDLQPGERSSPPRMLSHHPEQGLSQAKRRLRILIGFPLPAPASSPSLALVVEVEESPPFASGPSPSRAALSLLPGAPIILAGHLDGPPPPHTVPLIDHRPSTPVLRSISARHVHVHPRLAHRDPRQHKPTPAREHEVASTWTKLHTPAPRSVHSHRRSTLPPLQAAPSQCEARPTSAPRSIPSPTARGTSTSTAAPSYRTAVHGGTEAREHHEADIDIDRAASTPACATPSQREARPPPSRRTSIAVAPRASTVQAHVGPLEP